MQPPRIALFGGSFDPPHRGHRHIALAAAERLGLHKVLLAPAGRQPLKSHEATAFAHRLAMVELLVAGQEQLQASQVDAPCEGPNYTVETLARLRATLPVEAQLFFLAGADSLLSLPQWRDPEALLKPASQGGLLDGWILAARPGFDLGALPGALPPGYHLGAVGEQPGPVLRQAVLGPQGAEATPLWLLPDLDDAATATRVRAALEAGEPAADLTPEVAHYIARHGLYRVLG